MFQAHKVSPLADSCPSGSVSETLQMVVWFGEFNQPPYRVKSCVQPGGAVCPIVWYDWRAHSHVGQGYDAFSECGNEDVPDAMVHVAQQLAKRVDVSSVTASIHDNLPVFHVGVFCMGYYPVGELPMPTSVVVQLPDEAHVTVPVVLHHHLAMFI